MSRPVTGSSPLPLEALIRHLASFIGPIAKVVVHRAAAKAGSLDELYLLVAPQIESEKDRHRFLRERPQ